MFLAHFLFVILSIFQSPSNLTSRVPRSCPGTLTVDAHSSAANDSNFIRSVVPTSVAASANITPAAGQRIPLQVADIEGNVSVTRAAPQSYIAAQTQADIMTGFKTRSGLLQFSSTPGPMRTVLAKVAFVLFVFFSVSILVWLAGHVIISF